MVFPVTLGESAGLGGNAFIEDGISDSASTGLGRWVGGG